MNAIHILKIIDSVGDTGIPKPALRTAFEVQHGQIGMGEMDGILSDFREDAMVRIERDKLTKDERFYITKLGMAALRPGRGSKK